MYLTVAIRSNIAHAIQSVLPKPYIRNIISSNNNTSLKMCVSP